MPTDYRAVLIKKLQEGREETVALFQGLNETERNTQVYQDGMCWTVTQLLAHLSTIEVSMQTLFRNILAGGRGAPEDFDIDRFNRSRTAKLQDESYEELIERFTEVRRNTIEMVRAMSADDLHREGFHPYHGHGKLKRFISWAYEHAHLHENDIRLILNKQG